MSDDAAKARGVVVGMALTAGLLTSAGVSAIWARSTDIAEPTERERQRIDD